MRIVVRLAGGLGNQLFQIAKALEYISDSDELVLYYKSLSNYQTKRHLADSVFLPTHSTEVTVIENLILLLRISKIYNLIRRSLFSFKSETHLKIADSIFLDGYFQNQNHKGLYILRNYIRERAHQRLKNTEGNFTSCVHVRLTDADKFFQRDSLDLYYKQGLGKIESTSITIVSDDPQRAFAYIKSLNSFLTVNFRPINSETEDFFYIARCDQIITAPSTFSWWAGFISYATFYSPGYFLNNPHRAFFVDNEIQLSH